MTDAFTREGVSFINRHATEPFFLFLSYNAPHEPYQAPQSYLDRVANISDPQRRLYAAMVTALDDGVGQVLQTLQAQNLLDKTLIFFLSDNGAPDYSFTRNYPFRGYKLDVLEGGIRVPFAVQWTGRLPAHAVYDEPVSSLDIVATAAAVTGVSLPTDRVYDGMNVIPYLAGEQVSPPRTFFWRWFGLGATGPWGSSSTLYAARTGALKLVVARSTTVGGPPELYNLSNDLGETRNLALSQPGDAVSLKNLYDQWNTALIAPLWQSPSWAPDPIVLAGDWNAFNKDDSTSPWKLTQITAPGIQGTPDGFDWFTSTIHVAATGGDTTPGMHSFVLLANGSYSNQWGGVTINIDDTTSVPFFSGVVLGPTNSISLQDGFHYSFRILNQRKPNDAGDPSLRLAVMKTSAPPVSVSVSGQTPTTPTSGDSVVVSLVTSQPKSAEERIYLRWSTDTFITSHMVEAVGTGVDYSAVIPAQPAGTSVQYCSTTSTVDLSSVLTSGIIDSLTLSTTGNFKFVVSGPAGPPPPLAPSPPPPTPPSITTQPANKTVTAGQTATFSVTATGTAPLSYQWKKNGANISGATHASYTTPATTQADNGSLFAVIVSNSAGSVTSNNATLTVNPLIPPSITTQPANKTVTAGQTATFSVTATGTAPLSYQWKKNGANITGATSASYTTPATTQADNGSLFAVIVSNSAGSMTSNDATLTVNALMAPSITTQPVNRTVTAGQTAMFSVTATGTATLSYQWTKNGANINGATHASYTTPATTQGDNGSLFAVLVSNSAGSVTSNNATLTVNALIPPSITTQPANKTVTAGQTATFSVTATGTAPLSYQWKKNGANISGATSASYTTPATTQGDNGSLFAVIVSNSAGSVTSNNATLTVNALIAPSITTQPANKTVTAGQTATFSVTATGTAPLSYQWKKNGANISGATSASYTTPATTQGDNGSLFAVIVSNSAGSVTSNNATLTVNPLIPPSITTQPANKTVTAGQTATFSVTATGTAPLSYQWKKNGANISGATSASYTTPATTQGDNGSLFAVIVSNSVGSVTSNNATLTVNPMSTPTPTPTPTATRQQPQRRLRPLLGHRRRHRSPTPTPGRALGTLMLGTPTTVNCPTGFTCTNFTVICPGLAQIAGGIADQKPTVQTRGLVVFFSGSVGGSFWSMNGVTTLAQPFLQSLLDNGFEIVQIRWGNNGWLASASGCNLARKPWRAGRQRQSSGCMTTCMLRSGYKVDSVSRVILPEPLKLPMHFRPTGLPILLM